jgi:hypothetical protein
VREKHSVCLFGVGQGGLMRGPYGGEEHPQSAWVGGKGLLLRGTLYDGWSILYLLEWGGGISSPDSTDGGMVGGGGCLAYIFAQS